MYLSGSFAVRTQTPQQPTQLTHACGSHCSSGGALMRLVVNHSVKTIEEEGLDDAATAEEEEQAEESTQNESWAAMER